jgi:hypothetical protein
VVILDISTETVNHTSERIATNHAEHLELRAMMMVVKKMSTTHERWGRWSIPVPAHLLLVVIVFFCANVKAL